MTDQTDLDSIFTTHLTLRSGEEAWVRLLKASDGAAFGVYLEGLSAVTRGRWGPHHHDRATAEAICAALDPGDWIRVVAETDGEADKRIIAYMMLNQACRKTMRLDARLMATLWTRPTTVSLHHRSPTNTRTRVWEV